MVLPGQADRPRPAAQSRCVASAGTGQRATTLGASLATPARHFSVVPSRTGLDSSVHTKAAAGSRLPRGNAASRAGSRNASQLAWNGAGL